MSKKIVKVRNGRLVHVTTKPFGIVDGVAGAWTNPRYIDNPSNNYMPGTRQYYGRIANSIRRSYESYKSELECVHD